MEYIFHEKQVGMLCAQHCLNALLQGPYFNPVDLAEIGHGLDEFEKQQTATRGILSQEPSSNFDDSGYFSIQVLQKALEIWNLELVPFNSSDPISQQARSDPSSMQAFICNFKLHWFTIRKLAHSWFDLNSMKSGPELISDTYLSLFLNTLRHEGYSVFVVSGNLPPCEADRQLRLIPRESLIQTKPPIANSSRGPVDKDLQMALDESRRLYESEDSSSLSPAAAAAVPTPDADEIRKLRLKFLEKPGSSSSASSPS